MAKNKRVELYRRLPEIYRIKDEDLSRLYLENGHPVQANQLLKFLEPVEDMFSAVHENIESLYHDLFIETCDPWVIPYIADLLGTSHIAGDEWTRRADVADTIALRRRKGTLGAIELLTFILTKWGVHSVELLENMVWNQHLNHQRPDEGGTPPYSLRSVRPATPRRGGTVSLRDPSLLAQLNTPFDPFAHVADVKPHETGQVRVNLPNLAIYLWRLKDYRLEATKPHALKVTPIAHPFATAAHPQAPRIVRLNIDPVPVNNLSNPYVKTAGTNAQSNKPEGRPATLFNTNRLALFARENEGTDGLNISAIAPRISTADQVPGPIPRERISDYEIADAYDASLASPIRLPLKAFTDASFTAPQEYLSVEAYDQTSISLAGVTTTDVGLQLLMPQSQFPGSIWPHTIFPPRYWKIRGVNLTAWERGINPPLNDKEIAVDPVNGRIAIGVANDAKANALVNHLLVTFTYGAAGPVGAHPISYHALPDEFDHTQAPTVIYKDVVFRDPAKQFQSQLKLALEQVRAAVTGGGDPPPAIVIEIMDSRTHPFNIDGLNAADRVTENGIMSILLHCPLIIRSADNQRPVVELARPLAFRPAKVVGADAAEQAILDARIEALFVRLEGLYIARDLTYSAGLPLIARAAIGRLDILNSTLDPGGFKKYFCDPATMRAPRLPGINLEEPFGFANNTDEFAFKQTPEINIQRSISGAVFTDEGYRLCIEDSIVESIPINVSGTPHDFAVSGATAPGSGFAGATVIRNVTVLGRARVYSIEGSGGIFTGALEAFDQQAGCLKYCYFADDTAPAAVKNKLPQHFACVFEYEARLIFTSDYFGEPGYCQLSLECDRRILEVGVGSDQMGAFNFLGEAYKWRNLQIRFREFMPVGIRLLLIPAT